MPKKRAKLATVIPNICLNRNYKRISRVFRQFCDFTSIGGFRYFTVRTPFHIRISAIIVFCVAVGLLIYQLSYIINQYSHNSLSTTTSVIKSSSSFLPYIFICPSMINQTKFPLFAEYFEEKRDIVKPCIAKIDEKIVSCVSKIKRTLIGFCVHISYNFTELKKHKINQLAVKHFYLRFNYPINGTSNVKLFLIPFNETQNVDSIDNILFTGMKPPLTTLLPNALTVIRINELFTVSKNLQKVPLKVEGMPNLNSFETNDYLICIDSVYKREITKAKCNKNIFIPLKQEIITENMYSIFDNSLCSLYAAKIAKINCEPLESDAKFYLADISSLSNYKLPKFITKYSTAGNVIITFRGMLKRTTLYTRKTEIWKLISDIGGTFSLYTGFTFLSILETIAFFSSSRLRKSAAQDEQTLMERKNPPIKFPLPLKRLNKSAKKLKQKVENIRKHFEEMGFINDKTAQKMH